MNEPEVTPEIARSLFDGRNQVPAPGQPEQPGPGPEGERTQTVGEAEHVEDESELSADQIELANRYGLSAPEVRRVRGRSWTEKCEDAERLAAIVSKQPNRGEIAALAAG